MASGCSFRVRVTEAPVCRGLISTDIFQVVNVSAGDASRRRKPLFTRPLKAQQARELTGVLTH